MKRRDLELEPELAAFLVGGKVERTLPPVVRARALANARAALGAGRTSRSATISVLPSARPQPVASKPRAFRIAVAAAIVVAIGTAGAVAALRARSAHVEEAPVAPPPRAVAKAIDATVVPTPSRESPPVAVKRPATVGSARLARAIPDVDPFTGELVLLQPAHAAYARGDFAKALVLIAEHARRFPKGHLAEEREALRVQSLAAAGRTEEAHRAAAAFQARFPRSILLPHPR